MLKKLTALLMAAMIWLPAVAQDDVRNIVVKVDDAKPCVLEYDFCTLSITATEAPLSSVTMNIDVENTNESYSLYLFGHAFSEKALKSQKISFDKKSYGTTSRNILVCDGLDGDGILRIEPYGNRVLRFPDITEAKKTVELPVYIAKYEKKKFLSGEKYLIRQRVKLIINVTFELPQKIDQYEEIKAKYDDLVARIEANPVCTSKKHPVSEQEQVNAIQTEIDNLKDEIADIKAENRWRERDEAYRPYKELLVKLDNIVIPKEVCSKCSRTASTTSSRHECRFCSKSPSDILLLLQRTYQELDNRKITKSEALKKIDAAHKAWTKDCKNLKQKIAADSAIKYKIDKYYDAIVNY